MQRIYLDFFPPVFTFLQGAPSLFINALLMNIENLLGHKYLLAVQCIRGLAGGYSSKSYEALDANLNINVNTFYRKIQY